MSLKNFLTAICILMFTQVNSQIPNWEWAKNGSISGLGGGEGIGIALDAHSNVYVSGFFQDTLNFGPYSLRGGNSLSGFIAKYDSSGNILWAKCDSGASSTDVCYGYFVCTDNFGNSYFSGYFNDTISFDSHVIISNGGLDIFLVKYDSLGNVSWARHAGGIGHEEGLGLSVDAIGNIYVTGFFNSPTVNFGSSVLTNAGSSDILLAKYDSAGNELWAVRAGSAGTDDGFGITCDNLGNIYVTGYFNSASISFASDTIFNSGNDDYFLAKYDSSGNAIWGRGASGSAFDKPTSVTNDSYGNIYVTGLFNSPTITFNSIVLTNSSANNTFLVKYNSLGNVIWAKNVSGSQNRGYCVATDIADKVFLTGSLGDTSTIFFDTLSIQSPVGSVDPMYIVCYDSSGNSRFAKALSSGGDDWSAIKVSQSGCIYIGGDYKSNPFIVRNDTFLLSGEEDVFVAKLSYSASEGVSEIKSVNGCLLFPNPFSNSLFVSTNDNEPSEIILYDILSRKLLQRSFTNAITIHTERLANGLYIYELRNKNGILANGKVFKQ